MVSGFSPEVTMCVRPPLVCGILSSSSDIERCRAVVSGVIWIRLLDSARPMYLFLIAIYWQKVKALCNKLVKNILTGQYLL